MILEWFFLHKGYLRDTLKNMLVFLMMSSFSKVFWLPSDFISLALLSWDSGHPGTQTCSYLLHNFTISQNVLDFIYSFSATESLVCFSIVVFQLEATYQYSAIWGDSTPDMPHGIIFGTRFGNSGTWNIFVLEHLSYKNMSPISTSLKWQQDSLPRTFVTSLCSEK